MMKIKSRSYFNEFLEWRKYAQEIEDIERVFFRIKETDVKMRILSCFLKIIQLKEHKDIFSYSYGYSPMLLEYIDENKFLKKPLCSWFDHPAKLIFYKYDEIGFEKRVVPIIEPYGISMENIKELISVCEQKNITFDIMGESIHFPNRTIQIRFFKR